MIYDITGRVSSHEQFGLVTRLRRAAISVPSNIAGEKAHYSNRDFVRFLPHARRSLAEIEAQILIAQQRKYVSAESTTELSQKLDELGILSSLINSHNAPERTRDSRAGTQD